MMSLVYLCTYIQRQRLTPSTLCQIFNQACSCVRLRHRREAQKMTTRAQTTAHSFGYGQPKNEPPRRRQMPPLLNMLSRHLSSLVFAHLSRLQLLAGNVVIPGAGDDRRKPAHIGSAGAPFALSLFSSGPTVAPVSLSVEGKNSRTNRGCVEQGFHASHLHSPEKRGSGRRK